MSGGVRVVVDDAGDGTGMLVVPAAAVTAADIATLVRYGSGFLFVTLSAAAAARLDLPAMRGAAHDGRQAARQRVSVDAATGVGTGISAADRARTVSLLAHPTTVAADLRRPGHVVPVVVDTGHPRLRADRVHLAVGGPAVYADLPGGPAGTGLAGVEESAALAAALGLAVEGTRPTPHERPEPLVPAARTVVVR